MVAVTVSHLRGGAGALLDLVVLDQDTSDVWDTSLLPTQASGAIIAVTELSWKEAPHELRRY